MIFNYDANKTHFHNKGFALNLVLKVSFFGTRKWPINHPAKYVKPIMRHINIASFSSFTEVGNICFTHISSDC